jgi:DnaJ-class molecular chaperone
MESKQMDIKNKKVVDPQETKCSRCNGKGGYEQPDFGDPDNTHWDICPVCDGTGK